MEEFDFESIAIPSQYDGSSLRLSSEVETYEVMLIATDKDGNEVEGLARVTLPADNDHVLVNFEVTTNIMEVANLDSDFWINSSSDNLRIQDIGSCTKNCTDPENDIKRRGWCKALCWTKEALVVTALIIAVI